MGQVLLSHVGGSPFRYPGKEGITEGPLLMEGCI